VAVELDAEESAHIVIKFLYRLKTITASLNTRGGCDVLTPKQVAVRIGVSASLVYEWCGDGLLKHYRFGGKGKRGCIRIEEADLQEFLQHCRQEGRPAASLPPLRHINLPRPS
jgi:excisionase family DNA binding protein